MIDQTTDGQATLDLVTWFVGSVGDDIFTVRDGKVAYKKTYG